MIKATASKSGSEHGSAQPRPNFAKTYFPVQAAEFEHANDGRANYSVKLSRSFRRDEGSAWETAEYLGTQDLLPAARLLGEAYEAIWARQDKLHRERQQPEEGSGNQR